MRSKSSFRELGQQVMRGTIDRLDTNLFQLLSEEGGGKGSDRGESVGTPTRYTWVIKSKKTGNSTIKMSYYRVWEGKDQAIRRFEVEVEVSP